MNFISTGYPDINLTVLMKHYGLAFMAVIVTGISFLLSCSQKEDDNTVICVWPDAISFDVEGGTRYVPFETSDQQWTVSSLTDWLTVEKTGNDFFMVSSQPSDLKEDRSGELLISAGGEESVVSVLQKGVGDFWGRSVAYHMGFKGAVKTCSDYVSLVNNLGEVTLSDLDFDKNGNLLKFTASGGNEVNVEYDEGNRIAGISSNSGKYGFSIGFEYSSSARMVPVFELFEYDLDVLFPVDFRIWLPFLSKGLSAVKIRDSVEPDNDLDFRFVENGDKISVDAYYPSGEEMMLGYYEIHFNGNYPDVLTSESGEYASYSIDEASGMILKQTMASTYDIAFERETNRYNTISRAVYGSYDMSLTYNGQLDLTSRKMSSGSDMASLSVSYQYDETGNWVRADITPETGDAAAIARQITYWE